MKSGLEKGYILLRYLSVTLFIFLLISFSNRCSAFDCNTVWLGVILINMCEMMPMLMHGKSCYACQFLFFVLLTNILQEHLIIRNATATGTDVWDA